MENVVANILAYYKSFLLTTTWENDGSYIFQGQVICQVEMTILCKNVTFVTLNCLY